jgi:hypothetical protein
MLVNRWPHNAILLPSGRVLLSSGAGSDGFLTKVAEKYDVPTNSWLPAGLMVDYRFGQSATLLADGTVLAAGGDTTDTSEIFTPVFNAWSATGSLTTTRQDHRAVRLQNGSVLVSGGENHSEPLSSAEVYQPGATPLVSLSTTVIDFGLVEVGASQTKELKVKNQGTAPLIISGASITSPVSDFRVAVLCGSAPVPRGGECAAAITFVPQSIGTRSASLQLQDNAPDSPRTIALTGFGYIQGPLHWAPTGSMTNSRYGHTSTILADGRILVVGGSVTGDTRLAEIYDPVAGTWSPAGLTNLPRNGHSATLLRSGKVLVCRGRLRDR